MKKVRSLIYISAPSYSFLKEAMNSTLENGAVRLLDPVFFRSVHSYLCPLFTNAVVLYA